METILTTERLILRPWLETDAESLYKYAKDPDIGIPAGWPPHKSVEESLDIIKNVLRGEESYAICEKDNDEAIGAIALKLNGSTDMTERDDECELGYWLGKPFWGRGYIPEAAMELLRHGQLFCLGLSGERGQEAFQSPLGRLFSGRGTAAPAQRFRRGGAEASADRAAKIQGSHRATVGCFRSFRRSAPRAAG